jgi:uncharacterized protein YbjT (DUF2867 family)
MSADSEMPTAANAAAQSSSDANSQSLVLVAGATGGVGQLVVANLISAGYRVRVLTRSFDKVKGLFSDSQGRLLTEALIGDIRQSDTLPAATEGVSHIICTTGTTALPSNRWDFDVPLGDNPLSQAATWAKIYLDADFRNAHARNSPEAVDALGVSNLVQAAPADLQRFVFVSSCGVARRDQLPYSLLNAFGVLDAKGKGEMAIMRSRLPYTVIRPGQLTDGPYTSRDFNTLVQASTQGKLGVVVDKGDRLNGQTSRIDVAAACVAALGSEAAKNKAFEVISKGDRPAQIDWPALFAAA